MQLCDFWKRVPSCIFDSRAVCESILKRLHDHAKDRMRSQAQQHLLTKSWSICNPATASSLYKQLTLDTFKYASDTSGSYNTVFQSHRATVAALSRPQFLQRSLPPQ
jgi:hypothetical protein